jgi:signal transduction histidine kinase
MNNNSIKCWEYYKCKIKKCPAFHSEDKRCWLICGTFCHNKVQATWLEKMEICIECEVFNNNFTEKDWKETLSLISKQFKDYNEAIQEKQKTLDENQKKLQDFKRTSIYLLKELDIKTQEVQSERDNLEIRIKEKTDELRKIHSKLMQSTKMAAIGRFSAGIAHEINNPLGAIINYVRNLLANPVFKDKDRGYLELTLKGLFRIEYIVTQILSYSGSQKSEPRIVNINKLIRDTIAFNQHKVKEKNIDVRLNLVDSLPQAFVDPFQIQQVFSNILNNSFDALEEKGKLKIKTFSDDRFIVMKFMDNGKGIKTDNLEKIFDPFYSTKEVGKGTGLGLFISYNIIQIYNGTIEVTSKEGKGTTVTLKLPVPENKP